MAVHGPCNVVAAVSDSGVICVIIDVISPSFRMGEAEVQGERIRLLGERVGPGFKSRFCPPGSFLTASWK